MSESDTFIPSHPHSLYLSYTFLFPASLVIVFSSPLTLSFSISLSHLLSLFIPHPPYLSLSLSPLVSCITSLNSYGLLNYLHKLLLYRDLLNILPRTTGVQNLQCHCLSPFFIAYFTQFPNLFVHLREHLFTINILCDV